MVAAALACAAATLLQLRWTFATGPTLRRTSIGLLAAGGVILAAAAVVEFAGAAELAPSSKIVLIVAAGGTLVFLATRLWREVPISSLVAASLAGVTALAVFLKGFDSHVSAGGTMTALTAVHVGAVVLGFVAFIPAYVLSVLFLSQEHRLKSKQLTGGAAPKLPSLMALEKRAWQLLYIGFPLYTVGVALGVLWAPTTDAEATLRPQHLLAATSWAVYAFAIYRRWRTGWRGRRAALALMGAFVTTFGAVLMYMMR